VARKKTSTSKTVVKDQISGRLRQIRMELFGEHGGPELARRLDLPARTWYNYETGVTVPAEVMLNFINQTNVNPVWLLSGHGNVFRESAASLARTVQDVAPLQLIRRALEQLELEKSKNRIDFSDSSNADATKSNYGRMLLLPLIEISECHNFQATRLAQRESFPVSRDWVAKPESSVCVIVPNNVMTPVLAKSGIVLVDLSVKDPAHLNNRMVIALDQRNEPIVRWFEHSGENLILRPEQSNKKYPAVVYSIREASSRILGLVLASFQRYQE
jgi:SOS-response transcriptional repressor LexA